MSVLALVSIAASLLLSFTPIGVDDDHVVVPGDTVSAIAKEYGISIRELVEANALANPNLIRIGEVLRIPGSDVVHTVVRGDTLAQIAGRYGTTVAELAAANGIVDVNRIIAGSSLTVTGGGGLAPTPTSAPAPAPAPTPTIGSGVSSYTVIRGDTLSSIAARLETTIATIMDLNGLTDPNRIVAGQSLDVPGEGFTCPVQGSIYINDWHFVRPGGRVHLGTDMFAAAGTRVVAPVSGELEQVDGSLGGLQFWLHGDDGYRYIGSHMSAFGIDGRVRAGDLIGYVGQTGNAKTTPPHLHFEISLDDEELNPYPTLKANGC